MSNNRKTFIINPKFQLKFAILICILIFVASLIYPLTIYDLMETMKRINPASSESIESQRVSLIFLLLSIQFGIVGVLFVVLIRISHKIAGPIYKACSFLQDIRAGVEYYPLKFRKGDQFTELATEINQTVEYLTERSNEELKYLTEIHSYIENLSISLPADKKPVVNEILVKLKKLQNS